jgi:hypothetical protein
MDETTGPGNGDLFVYLVQKKAVGIKLITSLKNLNAHRSENILDSSSKIISLDLPPTSRTNPSHNLQSSPPLPHPVTPKPNPQIHKSNQPIHQKLAPNRETPETKNYKLLLSIIKQVDHSSRSINWQLVAHDLGLQHAAAANLRWSCF